MNDKDYTMDFNKCLVRVLKNYLAMLDDLWSEAKCAQDKFALYTEILDVESLMEIFCR